MCVYGHPHRVVIECEPCSCTIYKEIHVELGMFIHSVQLLSDGGPEKFLKSFVARSTLKMSTKSMTVISEEFQKLQAFKE